MRRRSGPASALFRSPHIKFVQARDPSFRLYSRTSLGYLGECQTRASLQIDVVGKDERTQSPKGLSGEEIGLATLSHH